MFTLHTKPCWQDTLTEIAAIKSSTPRNASSASAQSNMTDLNKTRISVLISGNLQFCEIVALADKTQAKDPICKP